MRATGMRLLPAERRRQAQIAMIVRAMAGHTTAETERLAEALVTEATGSFKAAPLERLREHQRAGLPLVLVSAGMHPAIVRLGAALGGRGEGTRLVQRDGRYTAELDGPVCQGEGKAARARAVMDELGYEAASSYAYGDTASDIPFSKTYRYMPKHPTRLVPASPWAVAPGPPDPGQRSPLHRRFDCPRNSRPAC